jgi:tetratricopeptide (TPR) repeat protein
MPAMTFENLRRIAGYAVADGIASEDAYAAARAMKTRASGQDARFFAAATEGILMLNSGRPDAAAPVLASLSPLARLSGVLDEALFWGGDSARAASRLQDMLRVNRTMIDTSFVTAWTIAAWYYALGDLAQGDAWRARTMALAPAMQRAGVIGLGGEPLAPALLDAWHAVVHRRPDARARLERAEVARRASPPEPGISESALILARLWEELGEPRRALQLLEAMPYHHVAYMHLYLSTHRREAGRLAAQLGERELAIRNYRQYLEYRRKPEPALREEAAFVRRELDRLLSADREKRP